MGVKQKGLWTKDCKHGCSLEGNGNSKWWFAVTLRNVTFCIVYYVMEYNIYNTYLSTYLKVDISLDTCI